MCPQTPGAAPGGLASGRRHAFGLTRRRRFSQAARSVGARAAFAASAGFTGRPEMF
jgi:hypothetical protein